MKNKCKEKCYDPCDPNPPKCENPCYESDFNIEYKPGEVTLSDACGKHVTLPLSDKKKSNIEVTIDMITQKPIKANKEVIYDIKIENKGYHTDTVTVNLNLPNNFYLNTVTPGSLVMEIKPEARKKVRIKGSYNTSGKVLIMVTATGLYPEFHTPTNTHITETIVQAIG